MEAATTSATEMRQRPHHEGNNVMSWIGFKHIMYLAEEAVFEHLRREGLGFRRLFEEFELVPEIVATRGRILTALKLDDEVFTSVQPGMTGDAAGMNFKVTMLVDRNGRRVKAYTGQVRMVFRRDRSLGLPSAPSPPPADVASHVVDKACDGTPRRPEGDMSPEAPQHTWRFTVPYFYCHANDRLKMSGYLRLMEEADSRFCEQRGIGVGTLLRQSRWIPAVPYASMQILDEVRLDETIEITYGVTNIVKALLYTCAMDVHALREGERMLVASGEITHGYAEIGSRSEWEMITFDSEILRAIVA